MTAIDHLISGGYLVPSASDSSGTGPYFLGTMHCASKLQARLMVTGGFKTLGQAESAPYPTMSTFVGMEHTGARPIQSLAGKHIGEIPIFRLPVTTRRFITIRYTMRLTQLGRDCESGQGPLIWH
jgi:hypothetical protein